MRETIKKEQLPCGGVVVLTHGIDTDNYTVSYKIGESGTKGENGNGRKSFEDKTDALEQFDSCIAKICNNY